MGGWMIVGVAATWLVLATGAALLLGGIVRLRDDRRHQRQRLWVVD